MAMLPIVADRAFNRQGLLDDYISFIWTERYYESGDFELVVPITDKNVGLCQRGNYILRDDCIDIGIIEKLEYSTNIDNVEQMVVSGRFLTSLLGRRVISPVMVGQGYDLSQVLYLMWLYNIKNPTISARRMDMSFTPDSRIILDYTDIEVQLIGENLLQAYSDFAAEYDFGFRVRRVDDQFDLHLYDGVDRSYDQTENPYVVFSTEYDNLSASYYQEDYSSLVTDVWVNGETKDDGTTYATWSSDGTAKSGIDRYEDYMQSSSTRTPDEGTTLTEAQYLAMLQLQGRLSIRKMQQGFSGEVYFGGYEYRKDINIGDKCTLRNDRWGVHVNARLIEMIESTNEAGEYTTVPTFGL